MNKRQIGYFWINVNRYGWVVGLWNGGQWLIPQHKYAMPDYSIIEINEERILMPDEKEGKP